MEAIDSCWSRPFFVWFHYLTSLLCWLSCVLSSPGVVMKETDVSQYDIAIVQHTSKEYCFICQVPKAPGSKHCYFCNVCVPSWDHHCLWVRNCIGPHNIHFFSAFLIHCAWMWLQGAYICSCIAIQWTPLEDNIGKPSFIAYWVEVVNNQFQLALYATLLYIGGLVFLVYGGYYLFLTYCSKKTKKRTHK